MGDYRKETYLSTNYNKLKFEYGLSVEFLKDDNELIELLLGKLDALEDVEDLRSEIDDLKGELDEQESFRERCRQADVKIELLEVMISDLEGEIEILKIENNL